MKQIPAKMAINEYGYLINATDEIRFPYLWSFYCFHCSCPVELILGQDDQPAHFIHDLEQLTETAVAICPNIERPGSA